MEVSELSSSEDDGTSDDEVCSIVLVGVVLFDDVALECLSQNLLF